MGGAEGRHKRISVCLPSSPTHRETRRHPLQKKRSEALTFIEQNQRIPAGSQEVRVVRTFGPKNCVLDYNPTDETTPKQILWVWGNEWINNFEWDPKKWTWRRLGVLPITSVLNCSTKRGYKVAMRQENHQMQVDTELELSGFNSKERAKFFNKIWHPYLPRKVSAMQWLILTEGLPVGAWRERLGFSGIYQICDLQERETLQHAFKDCQEVNKVWENFQNTKRAACFNADYTSWIDISRGLMKAPTGPSAEDDLRWDTASAFSINTETPWDILRAQLLWATWCQRVSHAFKDEQFHLGVVLWHAWRNTIYCAMEAYKELFRHERNEEKRQEMIACFQTIWTTTNVFRRLRATWIK